MLLFVMLLLVPWHLRIVAVLFLFDLPLQVNYPGFFLVDLPRQIFVGFLQLAYLMILGRELFNQILLFSELPVQISHLIFQVFDLLYLFLNMSLALFKLCLILQDLQLQILFVGLDRCLYNMLRFFPLVCNDCLTIFIFSFSEMFVPGAQVLAIEGGIDASEPCHR